MLTDLAARFRICGALLVLALVWVRGADEKAPSLVGATRAQVIDYHGQPKRGLSAGNREPGNHVFCAGKNCPV